MFIPTSNVLKDLKPSINSGASLDVPANITSCDFGLNYTSSSTTFECSFFPNATMSYIAMSAINISGATVTVTIGGVIEHVKTVQRDNVLMFLFTRRNVSVAKIRISGNKAPTINNISGGDRRAVPNGGVNSGYSSQWLNRNIKTRTSTNSMGAPTATLLKREPLKINLTLPNMKNDFVEGYWQEFIDFASTGDVFYLTEQEGFDFDKPERSYACFNPTFKAPSAHSQTRALKNLTFGCNCYNGI